MCKLASHSVCTFSNHSLLVHKISTFKFVTRIVSSQTDHQNQAHCNLQDLKGDTYRLIKMPTFTKLASKNTF